MRRLQCEFKTIQNNQLRFPAPRSSKECRRGETNGQGVTEHGLGELQEQCNQALAIGTQRYQKHNADSGKVSELRKRSTAEWERLEFLTRGKLHEIATERTRQMEVKLTEVKDAGADQSRIDGARERWQQWHSVSNDSHGSSYDGMPRSHYSFDSEAIEEEISDAIQQRMQY